MASARRILGCAAAVALTAMSAANVIGCETDVELTPSSFQLGDSGTYLPTSEGTYDANAKTDGRGSEDATGDSVGQLDSGSVGQLDSGSAAFDAAGPDAASLSDGAVLLDGALLFDAFAVDKDADVKL